MRQGQSQAGRVGGRPAGDRQGCIRIWITEVIQVLRRHSVAHQGGIWGPGSPPVSAPPYQVCAGGAAEQDVCRTLTISGRLHGCATLHSRHSLLAIACSRPEFSYATKCRDSSPWSFGCLQLCLQNAGAAPLGALASLQLCGQNAGAALLETLDVYPYVG